MNGVRPHNVRHSNAEGRSNNTGSNGLGRNLRRDIAQVVGKRKTAQQGECDGQQQQQNQRGQTATLDHRTNREFEISKIVPPEVTPGHTWMCERARAGEG